MNLVNQVEQQLQDLTNTNHCGAGTIRLQHHGRELHCRLKSVERLACELETCRMAAHEFSNITMPNLEELAERLSDKLSYLEEKIVLVEKDTNQICAQLRSQAPYLDGDKRRYFELMVGAKGLALHRYEKPKVGQRSPVASVLSRSIFTRLCSDLLKIDI